MQLSIIFFASIALSVVAPIHTPVVAQSAPDRPTVVQPPDSQTVGKAVRATTPPTIDGRDTDAVWQIAPAMTDFRQFDPGENLPPTFRTEARVAYDNRNLYVLVRAFDPHPDSIQSLLSRRDVKTASDQLKIIIDAYHDRRSGVEMAVNPAGVKRDFSIYSDVVEDQTWDGVWDVATHIDSLGWIAEFRVPFSQLRFTDRDVQTFGFGVWRDVQRLNERMAWPTFRQSRRTLVSQLGTLEGIEGIGTPRRLELLPYSVFKNVPNPANRAPGSKGEIAGGLDLKAGLGSRVTVDATINPDFGQVEADPAVLNLSAFEIRFDERRPFFQEGAGLYKCGGSCEGVFYTRRIGRTPQLGGRSDPQFTNILAAVKATGRLDNGIAFGLVNAQTEQVRNGAGNTVEPRTNYLVARALREMRGGRSQLGLLVTDVRRQQDANTDKVLRRTATTLLAQGYHRFARDRWETNAYTALNTVEGSAQSIALTQRNSVHLYQRPDHEQTYDSTRTSMGGMVAAAGIKQIGGKTRYENSLRYASAGVEANDLGFVTLVNDVSFRQQLDVRTLKPNRVIRSAFSTTSFATHWTPGGMLAAQTLSVHSSASLHNNLGGAITASLSDIGGTNCVSCARGGPALRQSPRQSLRLDILGDSRKSIVPSTAYRVGVSDGGRSWSRGANAGLEVRVASRFSTSLHLVYDEITNDQQWIANYGALLSDTVHYTFARLHQHIFSLTGRANWTATPTLSFQLYLQPFVSTGEHSNWREIADAKAENYEQRFQTFRETPPTDFNVKQFNSNAVLRWEYRPASTLFLVWQQGRQPGSRNPGSFAPYRDLTHIFESRPLNTLLVKFSYWFTP